MTTSHRGVPEAPGPWERFAVLVDPLEVEWRAWIHDAGAPPLDVIADEVIVWGCKLRQCDDDIAHAAGATRSRCSYQRPEHGNFPRPIKDMVAGTFGVGWEQRLPGTFVGVNEGVEMRICFRPDGDPIWILYNPVLDTVDCMKCNDRGEGGRTRRVPCPDRNCR